MSTETDLGAREGVRPSRPATDSIADGVRSRPTYAVSLEMFEGPLDLLLHLVRRHELDILDIPIAFITEKYIEYISFARSLDIEIAGEYLLMAATLAFLKSRELLPPTPGEDEESEDEEEGVDPREELIRRLIEYERFRDASEELGNRPLFGRDVFPRGGSPDVVLPEPGLAPVTLFRLAEAYNRVLDRAKIREDHEVVIEPVTVRQRMRQLSLLLSDKPRVEFEALFLQQTWSSERELRQMLVVTLMSVLEMVKLGLLGVHQAQGSETLELERTVEVDEMSEAISIFREEGEEDEPAALAAEPKVASAVEAEAVVASEVAVEAEIAVASEVAVEAEIAVASEVAVEAEAEATSGVAAEPEPMTAPEAEAASEVAAESESEVAAEVDSMAASEAELEAAAEAEPEAASEVAAEAEPEAVIEPEPEAASEVVAEHEPEAASEVAAEPAPELAVEPEAETAVESEPQPEPVADPQPSEDSGHEPAKTLEPDPGEIE